MTDSKYFMTSVRPVVQPCSDLHEYQRLFRFPQTLNECLPLLASPPPIRLNDAPVRGYEDDVGNKTTMRFFYPESASYNPELHNEPGTLMVLVPFKQQDLRWLKEILYNEKRVQMTPPPISLPSHLILSLCLS